jgi:hypothetical protein
LRTSLIFQHVYLHSVQYARKPWGRSKSADLARLKRDLGHHKVAPLTGRHITEYFGDRNADGAGAVVVSAQLGYLIGVLEIEGISRLFAAGYRIEQVALVSGHRDWAMLKRYTHVHATDLHREAKS